MLELKRFIIQFQIIHLFWKSKKGYLMSEEKNNSTIELCRATMKEIQSKDLQQIKNCLLSLCDLIEKNQSDDFASSLTSILEIIVYHITTDPAREKLILRCLLNFDDMLINIHESKTRTDFLLNKILDKVLKNKNNISNESDESKEYDQLNLFNPDGSRCSMDEILNS